MRSAEKRALLDEITVLRSELKRAEAAVTYWKAGMCTSLAQCVQATHQVEQARRVLEADRERLVTGEPKDEGEG